jgi:predicted Zn-dependent protease
MILPSRKCFSPSGFFPFFPTIFLVFLSAFAFTGCASMRRGTQSWVVLPTSMEVGVGQGVAEQITRQYPVYNHAEVSRYIGSLGEKIVSVCDRKDVSYHFTVLDSSVVNAFAAPGGYIYITNGLLAKASNEAEVVTVLSHEVGHIVARHSAQQIQTQYAIGLTAEVSGLNKTSPLFQNMVGLGTNLALQGYSRENEFEADYYGALYASRLGYDPNAEVTFFKKLQKEQGKSPDLLTSWFSSHPPTDARIREFDKIKGELPSQTGKLNQQEYLKGVAPILAHPPSSK